MVPPKRADILLVEDDPGDVTVFQRAFRREGLDDRLLLVQDGAEALAFLLGGDAPEGNGPGDLPRVVFLDLNLPKVKGLEVLRALRHHERTRDLPVVIVSSSDRYDDIEESYRLGANSFVTKRFEPTRPGHYLVEAARYWLELNRIPV